MVGGIHGPTAHETDLGFEATQERLTGLQATGELTEGGKEEPGKQSVLFNPDHAVISRRFPEPPHISS